MANQHRTVWKYTIPVQDDPVTVELPVGAEIVDIATSGQPDTINLWAVVEPAARLERRVFIVRGTGQPVPAGVAHRGTVHWPVIPAPLVFHVFEVIA
ncbi:hypothetical protein ACLBWP_03435 [Microbacterium sp. M1A1_1b]